jgi:hypothetical protein
MTIKRYLLSLPERVVRSALGLTAGVAREAGDVVVPDAVRRSRLYQNLVDTTLRFVIEQIGGVEGVYKSGAPLPQDFLMRRGAGNAIELLGIVAFRASPVWVLAALADVCGLGRHLIPQIADELKGQGLLEPGQEFTSVDQILDGLERTSGRLAETVNTPPLDVASLREEWSAFRQDVAGLQASASSIATLPSAETITGTWTRLKTEATRQDRSVFETSSMLAVAAVRSLPENARWLSAGTVAGASRTGRVIGGALLDYYGRTLHDISEIGYVTYARQQLTPYVRAAASQFSTDRTTLTDRLIDKIS